MRLWHKDLIPVLPRQQLLSQWRECCGIKGRIEQDGSPKHILVNRVMDYSMDHFYTYCKLISQEMFNRKYKISAKSKEKIWTELWSYIDYDELFSGWHNDIYLRQCLYNLEEKYICGGIPNEEWQQICAKFPEFELCT